MKKFVQVMFLVMIACSALLSVQYAVRLYRDKYRPRYLTGIAC